MPNEEVHAVIRKAISDDVFRIGLSKDFNKTVSDHNIQLNPQDHDALSKVDWSARLPSNLALGNAATWVHIYKTDAGNIGNVEQ